MNAAWDDELVSVASPERLRRDLVDLLHRTSDVREFSLRATRILARAVPFDGSCMLTIDPAGMKLVPKGKRNGLELAWKALISGDAALATALNASVQK